VSHEHLTGTIDDKEQTFSNSFVLLRHTYETPKGAQIKFCSLYMHLLPLGEYSAAQLAKAPSIFHQKRYTVANHTDYALAHCDLNDSHIVLGYIPHGSAFEASSDPALHGEWRRVSFNGLEGCVDTGRRRAHQTHPHTNSYTATPTQGNTSPSEQGINLRDAASAHGRVVAFAKKGTELRFKDPTAHDNGFLKTEAYRELEAGGVFVHVSKASVSAQDVVAPIQYDSVVNLNPPLKVKAGELLGYAGPYCNREAVAHVEIFTDTINFLDNPKQETWGKKDGELNAYTWPGFKRFEENALSVNGYVDKAKFQLFNYGEDGVVDNSALLNDVDTNKDGNITINEIRNSVQQLRYHVCRHPTEWSAAGLDTKFARLKGDPWKLKENFYQQQLDHIKKLTFWEEVTQKPASSTVWHLHPVAFVAHLKGLRGITKDQLRKIMPTPHARETTSEMHEANLEKFLLPLNEMFERYGISESKIRQCHFIAQMAVETGALSQLAERGFKEHSKDPNYENAGRYYNEDDRYFYAGSAHGAQNYANALGNMGESDAVKFRGRGLLHLTGRVNYAKYWLYRGKIKQEDFTPSWWNTSVRNPKAAEIANPQQIAISPYDACDSAGWYWVNESRKKDSKRWTGQEAADKDDVTLVTFVVNGGSNGLDDRKRYLKLAKSILIGD